MSGLDPNNHRRLANSYPQAAGLPCETLGRTADGVPRKWTPTARGATGFARTFAPTWLVAALTLAMGQGSRGVDTVGPLPKATLIATAARNGGRERHAEDAIGSIPSRHNPERTSADGFARTGNDQKRHLLVDVFRNSPNLQDLPFTAYRAYQATVEWVDHALPYRDSSRFAGADRRAAAIIEGGADELKSRAAALLSKA